MKQVHIAHLQQAARTRRAGYLQACFNLGEKHGDWLHFTDEDHARLRAEFNPNHSPLTTNHSRGLGDAIHAVAGPIGRAIHWPCLKGDGTTDLKPNSPCDKLRNIANKITL